MIHYHGMPTSLNMADSIKVFAGRHILVSHVYPSSLYNLAPHVSSFILDNGAFSLWKSKVKPDWEAYYEWVEKSQVHPAFDWALIPDVIDGGPEENDRLLDNWPHHLRQGVPIWHLDEPLTRLTDLCLGYNMVAIGSSGAYQQLKTPEWWDRMHKAFSVIQGHPVHGLRLMDPKIVDVFPFKSCDSTTAGANGGLDTRWKGPFRKATKRTRVIAYCEYLESFQSSPMDEARQWQVGELFE